MLIADMNVELKLFKIFYTIAVWFEENLKYRTRAIITRGLYIFYPIVQCGL